MEKEANPEIVAQILASIYEWKSMTEKARLGAFLISRVPTATRADLEKAMELKGDD